MVSLTFPRFLWFLFGFLTEAVSPHSINVVVRGGGAPRFLVFIIHALKVLCTVVNKRKHATRAVARSPFCFYTARIQTWNRTVLYDSRVSMIEVKVPFTLFCTLQGHYPEECSQTFAGKYKK